MTVQNIFPAPQNSSIVVSQIPIFIICHAKATTIRCKMLVQSAEDGDTDDLLEIIYAGAESKTVLGHVPYNMTNRRTLGENNATVSETTTFAAADGVEVALKVPVCELLLTTGAGAVLNVGQRMVSAGAGLIKAHPDDLSVAGVTTAATTYYLAAAATTPSGIGIDPTIGILLSRVTTADAVQNVHVMPLW